MYIELKLILRTFGSKTRLQSSRFVDILWVRRNWYNSWLIFTQELLYIAQFKIASTLWKGQQSEAMRR